MDLQASAHHQGGQGTIQVRPPAAQQTAPLSHQTRLTSRGEQFNANSGAEQYNSEVF